ncbi:MAG: L,D-transpeptidase family protein [Candidatus Omnitrophota bacterium]|nr:L,D-transpeptidase family protein [Candidatus Omnitrophota bacterium]
MKFNRVLIAVIILVVLTLISFLVVNRKHSSGLKLTKNSLTAAELYNQANSLLEKGEFLAAKALYQKIINDNPDFKQISDVQKKSEDLNIRIIFSNLLTPQSHIYEVKSGDSLEKISKKFNTTAELIKKSNNLSSDTIQAGRKLRVWTGKFSILVDKSQNTLILKSNEEVIKSYRVSTGVNNSTPIGTFKIVNKSTNPVWFKAGAIVLPESPENVLGSRWLGFDKLGYGIHGTVEPQTIGQQITQGCVRMLNKDVEELYSIVTFGTEVEIVD